MSNFRKTIQRLIAFTLVVTIMVFNIPMNALFATDAISNEDENQVEVNVRVIGEGEFDVKFAVNGTNSVVSEICHKNEESTENELEEVTTEEIESEEVTTEEIESEKIETEETEEDTAEVVSTENEMLNEEESTQQEDIQKQQIEESEDNETIKEYTLVINKVEDELIITASATSDVSDKYSEIYYETYIATITYDGQETYDMPLVKYADISDSKLEFSNGIYSRDDIVFNGSNEYEIRFPYEVECKLVNTDEEADNEPTISKVEGTNNWLLSYHKPGTYTVNITSVSDSEQFAETEFNLKINNKLEFRYEDNKDKASENITITPSSEDNSLVGEVKKVISSENETFALELWGLYENDITYSLNDGATSTINAQTGDVSIGACETITVTATCNLTEETAQYMLVIEAAESDMTVFEDDNEDGQIGEDERVISDTGETVVLDAMDMVGKTVKVAAHMEESWMYDIVYSSNNENVADVSDDGTVTIKGVGSVKITVTADSKVFWKKDKSISYNIEVKKSGVNATIVNTETDEIVNDGDNDVITLYDKEIGRNDIIIDEETGAEILTLPLEIHLYKELNNVNKEIPLSDESITIALESGDLEFNGYTITNHEEIVRNEIFEVDVVITDAKGRFNDYTTTIKVLLDGDRTNDKDADGNAYYSVEGLHEGLDGNLWKDTDGNVLIEGNTIGEYTYLVAKGKYDNATITCEIVCNENEKYNKEHKIYVSLSDLRVVLTRLFFGVDSTSPSCIAENAITYTGSNIHEMAYGIFSNDSVTITVTANDPEGNLYDAVFYAGTEELKKVPVVKGDGGNGTFTLTLDKVTYAGFNDELTVVIRDAAGNESASYEIKDIVIESGSSESFITLSSKNDADMYENDGKIYASKDVILDVSVSDLVGTTEEDKVSGLASYEVYINGVKNDTLSKSYIDSITKVVSDSFELNTADYAKDNDGKITVEVKNIKDIVGNVGIEKSFTIYIDDKAPTAIYEGIQTSGKENITPYGNFYNADTTFIFKISDNMTGIKSATLTVGDKEITGTIADGKVSFVVPVGYSGQVSLKLVDYVNNVNYVSDKTLPRLNDIANEQGINVYTSDYILVENIVVGEPVYTVRQADKGNWHKSQVDLDIAITDESVAMVSSGLSSVTIYINDKEYQVKTYVNKDTIKDTFKVSIDNQWINDVINETGSYTVKLEIIDNAGNKSTYNKTVYIDAVAPVISDLTGVVDSSVNTGTVTVNVELDEKHYAESGNEVVVTVTKTLDGETTTYEADKFTYVSSKTSKLYTFTEDGTYELVVTSEDAAGNQAVSKSISFRIDNTAPLADIIGVTENHYYLDETDVTVQVIESYYEDADVAISITRELNGVTTVINSQIFNKTQKESALTQVFGDEGTYTIKVDAVDAAGNVALTKTVMFTIDRTAPTVEITGVENEGAYKESIIPSIVINDNYYMDYSVTLTKTGVYFNDTKTDIENIKEVDVTTEFIKGMKNVEDGVMGTFDTFEAVRENDGIYTLTVSARDYAGRETVNSVTFSVNRYGSVYVFDSTLLDIKESYVQKIDTDFVIKEFNADKLVKDSVRVSITRDGALLEEIVAEGTAVDENATPGESGWYQYEYKISKDNFTQDGVYVITVSSQDAAGNNPDTIVYDELYIRFAVDTTKPELVTITGLEENRYNANALDVTYQLFDAVGIKELRVYVNEEEIQKVNDFEDRVYYSGLVTIQEGMEQTIRFEIEDMAGNLTNSANEEDIKAGIVPVFNNTVTVSTNFFIRLYSDKPVFYGSIVAAVAVVAGSGALIVRKKNRKVIAGK